MWWRISRRCSAAGARCSTSVKWPAGWDASLIVDSEWVTPRTAPRTGEHYSNTVAARGTQTVAIAAPSQPEGNRAAHYLDECAASVFECAGIVDSGEVNPIGQRERRAPREA